MFRNRKYKTPRASSGQSTVEYIVLVTAVIATIIFFVAPGKDGKSTMQKKIILSLNNATEEMGDKAEALKDSHTDRVINDTNQKKYGVMESSAFDLRTPPAAAPAGG